MKLSHLEKITKDSYDLIAGDWESGHLKPFWQVEFQKLKDLLPSGRILEVGCGTGRDSKVLTGLGYRYLGVDISNSMIEQAKKNNPKADFRVGSIYDLDSTHSFDAFWCAATLIHIPKSRINAALTALKGSVVKKGLGFISVKEGQGEKLEDREELGNRKFLFSYYEPSEIEKILINNKFDILSKRTQYVSQRTTWLIYLLRSY